jgi:hypothetical protein
VASDRDLIGGDLDRTLDLQHRVLGTNTNREGQAVDHGRMIGTIAPSDEHRLSGRVFAGAEQIGS